MNLPGRLALAAILLAGSVTALADGAEDTFNKLYAEDPKRVAATSAAADGRQRAEPGRRIPHGRGPGAVDAVVAEERGLARQAERAVRPGALRRWENRGNPEKDVSSVSHLPARTYPPPPLPPDFHLTLPNFGVYSSWS